MYSDRIRTLERAYKNAEKSNKVYEEALREKDFHQGRVDLIYGLLVKMKTLELAVTKAESEWRESTLRRLESEIIDDLNFVYPNDGYVISLSTRVLRGKIHIEARAKSAFAHEIPGRITKTQGRLFQQVVSFAALLGVMEMLNIKTIYIDEAFSGSSKANVKKLSALLSAVKERGFNVVMIAQDTNLANDIDANRLVLSRSIDNKTKVIQEWGEMNV